MSENTDTQADGYYGEEAPKEDFDLSFLDEDNEK
jgi:hypothetical protein